MVSGFFGGATSPQAPKTIAKARILTNFFMTFNFLHKCNVDVCSTAR
jgi:hypothetical protein